MQQNSIVLVFLLPIQPLREYKSPLKAVLTPINVFECCYHTENLMIYIILLTYVLIRMD